MKLNKLFIIGFSSILLTAAASAEDKEKGKKKGPKGPKKTFVEVDTDKDGKVSEAEYIVGAKDADKAKERFAKKDKDSDSFLSKEEYDSKRPAKKGPKKPKKEKKPKAE